jgi:hypothetical protein
MLQPQHTGTGEHDDQVRDIVGEKADQHRCHRYLGRDAPPDQPSYDQHRAADATARQDLIGKDLRDAKRNEGPQRHWMSRAIQHLTPHLSGANVRSSLHKERHEQPRRTRRPHKLAHLFERTEMQRDENDGQEAQHTDHPNQQRQQPGCFTE